MPRLHVFSSTMFSMTEGATNFQYADNLCGSHALFYGIQPQLNIGGMQDCAGAWTLDLAPLVAPLVIP